MLNEIKKDYKELLVAESAMNNYQDMEVSYNEYADHAYQDYLEYSFYEFLSELKDNCIVPKTYNYPSNINDIKRFWEVA